MSFKRWKMGLFIALLSGVFTGLIGLGVGMTWKQILILMAINVGKDGLLFLQQNPAAKIDFDTQITKKTAVDGSIVETTSRKATVTTTPEASAESKTP